MLKIIPDWQNKDLTCHFCGETRSVKYTTKIVVIDTLPDKEDKKEVCVCNRCALLLNDIKEI